METIDIDKIDRRSLIELAGEIIQALEFGGRTTEPGGVIDSTPFEIKFGNTVVATIAFYSKEKCSNPPIPVHTIKWCDGTETDVDAGNTLPINVIIETMSRAMANITFSKCPMAGAILNNLSNQIAYANTRGGSPESNDSVPTVNARGNWVKHYIDDMRRIPTKRGTYTCHFKGGSEEEMTFNGNDFFYPNGQIISDQSDVIAWWKPVPITIPPYKE